MVVVYSYCCDDGMFDSYDDGSLFRQEVFQI